MPRGIYPRRRRPLKETRYCICGCGFPTRNGSAFVKGHDLAAAFSLLVVKHGSVEKAIRAEGYGDGEADDSLWQTYEMWREQHRAG